MENTPNPTPKKGNKIGLTVLILVVILLIAGTLWYAFAKTDGNTNNANTNQVGNKNTNTVINTNLQVNSNPTPGFSYDSSVDTANWQEYKNNDLGFKVEHPHDYVVMTEQLNDEIPYIRFVNKQYVNSEVSFPSITIQKYKVSSDVTLDQWVHDRVGQTNYSDTTTSIITQNNLDGTLYQKGSTSVDFAFKKDEQIFEISVGYYFSANMEKVGSGFANSFQFM